MEFFKVAAAAAERQVDAAKRAAKEQVQELRLGAMELAEDLTGLSESLVNRKTGLKDLHFKEGPLGFTLDGFIVLGIEPGSQAEALGLEIGDTICAVDGYAVPAFEANDFEAEERSVKEVKKWLRQMPRPSFVSFRPAVAAVPAVPREPSASVAASALSSQAGRKDGGSPRAESSDASDEAAVPGPGAGSSLPHTSSSASVLLHSRPALSSSYAILSSDGQGETQQQGDDKRPRRTATGNNHARLLSEDTGDLTSLLLREREEKKSLQNELKQSKLARQKAHAQSEALQARFQKRVEDLQAQLQAAQEDTRAAVLAAAAGSAGHSADSQIASSSNNNNNEVNSSKTTSSSSNGTSKFDALQRSEQRNAALEEQLAELRRQLDAASRESSEREAHGAAELEELQSRLTSALQQTLQAEHQIEALRREVDALTEAQETEMDLLRQELRRDHEEALRRREEQLSSSLRESQCKVEALTQELLEAQEDFQEAERRSLEAANEAAAAVMEATALRNQAKHQSANDPHAVFEDSAEAVADDDIEACVSAPSKMLPLPVASSPSSLEDASALRERVALLEGQCSILQKKLSSRTSAPALFSTYSASSSSSASGKALRQQDFDFAPPQRPSWELSAVGLMGPKVGAFTVVAYMVVDEALRNFTRRLLHRDAWLWIFYGHLLFLYILGASSYAEVLTLSDSETTGIELQQGKAPHHSGER